MLIDAAENELYTWNGCGNNVGMAKFGEDVQ